MGLDAGSGILIYLAHCKRRSTHKAKLIFLARIQQEFPLGITIWLLSSSPTQNPSMSVMSLQTSHQHHIRHQIPNGRCSDNSKIQIVAPEGQRKFPIGATFTEAISIPRSRSRSVQMKMIKKCQTGFNKQKRSMHPMQDGSVKACSTHTQTDNN